MLKIFPDNGKLLFCRRLVLLDKRAVHLELRLGAGRADGDPGAVLHLVLEQVRRLETCDALELVRGLRVVVVAVLRVELVQAVAERLALLLAAGGHLGDEQEVRELQAERQRALLLRVRRLRSA